MNIYGMACTTLNESFSTSFSFALAAALFASLKLASKSDDLIPFPGTILPKIGLLLSI
jgi:hypothetical protein